MKERTTQVLLGVVALLLAAHLLRSGPLVPVAQAGDDRATPEVLRARTFELVDDRGQVRANFKVEPGGEAVFRLRDAKGTIRVKLGASEDGSGLLLLDDRTEPGVNLSAKRSGTTVTLSEKGKENKVLKP